MWKLFAVGLAVLQTAQAIPHHPGFFRYQDGDRFGVNELEADVNSRLISNSTVVFPETVTVCARAQLTLSDHIVCIPITKNLPLVSASSRPFWQTLQNVQKSVLGTGRILQARKPGF